MPLFIVESTDFVADKPQATKLLLIPIGRCVEPTVALGSVSVAAETEVTSSSVFTQHQDKPFLRLLVLHDDGEREFDYTSGAEQALERSEASGWTVVSIKNDWATAF